MARNREPSFAATAIVATFRHRDQAEGAVERLMQTGLGTDHITMIPPDPRHKVMSAGGLIVAVEPCGLDELVRMILRDHGVDEVTTQRITADRRSAPAAMRERAAA